MTPAHTPTPIREPLFQGCSLPGCDQVAADPGTPCADCRQAFGPFLHRVGDPSSWPALPPPACGHPRWWWRRGRCDVCGCTTPAPESPVGLR